jgi:hypothetical protein
VIGREIKNYTFDNIRNVAKEALTDFADIVWKIAFC